MTGADVVANLAGEGVMLYLNDDRELRARCRPGALTPAAKATIAVHRADLLAALAVGAEATVAPAPPAVRLTGKGVLLTGLDNATRHRVMCAIADHHSSAVRRVATRHDYKGGVVSIAAESDDIAARVARLARRALELSEPNERRNGA